MTKTMRNMISVVLAVAIFLTAACITAGAGLPYAEPDEYYTPLGDVNFDFMMNAADARRILRVAAGLDKFYPAPEWTGKQLLGDVDLSGEVTSRDARFVLRMSAELMTNSELNEIRAEGKTTAAPTTVIVPPVTDKPVTTTLPPVTDKPVTTTLPPVTDKPVTTTLPPVTDPPSPIVSNLKSYYIKMRSVTGTQDSGVIEMAVTGNGGMYVSTPSAMNGFAFIVSDSGSVTLMNLTDKTYFTMSRAFVSLAGLGDLTADFDFSIIDFRDLSKFKVSELTEGTVTYRVFEVRDGNSLSRYYLDSGNNLKMIKSLDSDGNAITTVYVEAFSTDAAVVSSFMKVPTGYRSMSMIEFINKYSNTLGN